MLRSVARVKGLPLLFDVRSIQCGKNTDMSKTAEQINIVVLSISYENAANQSVLFVRSSRATIITAASHVPTFHQHRFCTLYTQPDVASLLYHSVIRWEVPMFIHLHKNGNSVIMKVNERGRGLWQPPPPFPCQKGIGHGNVFINKSFNKRLEC